MKLPSPSPSPIGMGEGIFRSKAHQATFLSYPRPLAGEGEGEGIRIPQASLFRRRLSAGAFDRRWNVSHFIEDNLCVRRGSYEDTAIGDHCAVSRPGRARRL